MGRKNRKGRPQHRGTERAIDRKRREQAGRDERDRGKLLARYSEVEPDGVVLCQFGTHAETAFSDGAVRLCLLSPKVHKLFGLCVGDRVWTERGATDNERVVVARADRQTEVRRKRGEEDRTGHVIAANVDQMAITVALFEPPLRTGAIDRYLVLASVLGVEPLLVLTKIDQSPPDDPGWGVLEPYREIGVPIVATSAATGFGLDVLRDRLRNRMTVFSGHSGVGKSSIAQALDLRDAPEAGEMSRSHGRIRGRHTTSVARLLHLPGGGWVVDTPGVRAIGLVDLAPSDACVHFPEFAGPGSSCPYTDCLHMDEADCAVREAADAGSVPAVRYASYRRLMDSLLAES